MIMGSILPGGWVSDEIKEEKENLVDLGPSPHTRLPGCGYHVTSCLMFLLPQSYPCQHASPANGLSARTVSPDKPFHSWVPLVRHLPQHHVGSSFEEADITHSCLTVVRPCQKQCHLGRWVLRGLSHLRSLGFSEATKTAQNAA